MGNHSHDIFTKAEAVILELLQTPPHRGWYGSELVDHSRGQLTKGNVYTALEGLVKRGFVSEEEIPPTDGLICTRTKHHLTDAGLRALRAFQNAQNDRQTSSWGSFDPSPA